MQRSRMNFTNRRARWLVWSHAVVLLGLCVVCITAQEGFLSIDCGSDVDYVDNVTGISWVTDTGYVSTGKNSKKLLNKTSALNYATQLWDLRYFPEYRMKHCYVLPVVENTTYLIRSQFLYSYFGTVLDTLSFDLTVNASLWTTVTFGGAPGAPSLGTTQVYEMVFRSNGTLLYVCLVANQGMPFISSLELRRLEDSMYNVTQLGKNLLLFDRLNFGVIADTRNYTDHVRYPDDAFDRYWENHGATSDNTNSCPSQLTNTTVVPTLLSANLPPVKVMDNACIAHNNSKIILTLSFPTTVQDYYAVLYIQEIDGNVSPSNLRKEHIVVSSRDNPGIEEVDTTVTFQGAQLIAPSTNLSDYYFLLTITKMQGSSLDPIVNAAEIYRISFANASRTNEDDIMALSGLQHSWNLTSWTADPCTPVPWDWISCSSDPIKPWRVTGIDLSGAGIVGTIPAAILNLTQLTDLWMDSNYLTGPIPNLSVMTQLQTLRLQNNSLTGAFPNYLFQLPNLTDLDVASNQLTGSVSSCAGGSNLTYRCDGNPDLLCPSGSRTCGESSSSSSSGTLGIALGVSLGGAVFVIICACAGLYYIKHRRKAQMEEKSDPAFVPKRSKMATLSGDQLEKAPGFSLDEVINATDHFTKKIGEGSFGAVYYGKLSTGEEVAVKVHTGASRQGEAEFVNEVNLLSRVHHKNLVSLLGFCEESEEQMLIYLYMSKGTLREHLYGNSNSGKQLDWLSRLYIAIQSARGLEYLHTGCCPPIIHRDVKSSNILLDAKLVAKVADFGLSKSGPEAAFASGISTNLKGTPGYFDPEYWVTQKLTQKSDVYSFGVVLLEIVSGRPPYHSELPDGSLGTLIEWMHFALRNDVFVVVDPNLEDKYNRDSMRKVIELAAACLQQRGVNRPDMAQVVQALLQAKELESSISRNSELSSPSGSEPYNFTASSSSQTSAVASSVAYMSFDPSYTQGR